MKLKTAYECFLVRKAVQLKNSMYSLAIHLLVMVPPKVSISDLMGILKGRTAIRVFNKFKHLKQNPYWGNHLWSKGYCVDTVGLDAEMIKRYVKSQENQDKREEQ